MATRKYSTNVILALTNYAIKITSAEIHLYLSKFKTNYTLNQLAELISLSLGTKDNLSALTYRETKEVTVLLHFNWILNEFDHTLQVLNGKSIISDSDFEKAEELVSIFALKYLRHKHDLQRFDILKDLDKFLLGVIELFYTITKLIIKGSHDVYKTEPDFAPQHIGLIDKLLAKDFNSILMKDLCKDLTKISSVIK